MNEKNDLSLEENDLIAINEFRKLKNTSVLTIMFTDIKGFTKMTEIKGEDFSNRSRRKHDEILVGIIEENQSGKVIKHIGDAVMAIFSEPSMAVDRALKIQKEMKIAEQSFEELGGLSIRIGLHMGQVTTEDNVSLDVFGRHVNRAARVESLADGGQVYMTYPVFDSAKGWLSSNQKLIEWFFHGAYFVKGIEHPIEIYEVIGEKLTKPKAPRKAKKKKAVPTWLISLCLVGLGILATLSWNYFNISTVTFTFKGLPIIIMDHKEEVPVDGDEKESIRKALKSLPKGKHIIHYDIRNNIRYYAEIEIKRGENFIRPTFKGFRLPSMSKSLYLYKEEKEKKSSEQASIPYEVYNSEMKLEKVNVDFNYDYSITRDPQDENKLKIIFKWTCKENGKTIGSDTFEFDRVADDGEKFLKRQIFKKNERVFYIAECSGSNASTSMYLYVEFIEYLKN